MTGKNYIVVLISVLWFMIYPQVIKSAERIISLAPSLTKNIYLLKAQDQLIGCTNYCAYAVNDGKEMIGSAIAVNIEKVVGLKPDIIIATTLTNPETIQIFKKLGVRIEVFGTPINYKEICDQFYQLGQLIGKEKVASDILNQSSYKMDSLKALITEKPKKRIFFQIGSNPIFTVLPNTFMEDFIIYAGGQNICDDMKRGTISREMVILRNPDVIIVSDMGEIGAREVNVWKSYENMNAVKSNNVFIVDSDKSCSPTPTDFIEVLKYIIERINY